jgi:hypothetical protein
MVCAVIAVAVLGAVGACRAGAATGAADGIASGTASGAPAPAPAVSASEPGTATMSPPAGAAPVSGACRARDLAVRLSYPNSAKFQEGVTIELANTGDPCTVSGYPSLQLLDEGGGTLTTSVRHADDGNPVTAVTLARGGRATAVLTWNKYEGQGTLCRPQPASLVLSLPGQNGTATAPWISGDDGRVCGGALTVSPLRAAR